MKRNKWPDWNRIFQWKENDSLISDLRPAAVFLPRRFLGFSREFVAEFERDFPRFFIEVLHGGRGHAPQHVVGLDPGRHRLQVLAKPLQVAGHVHNNDLVATNLKWKVGQSLQCSSKLYIGDVSGNMRQSIKKWSIYPTICPHTNKGEKKFNFLLVWHWQG